jgi:L-2-hydroxyglutarate oxidase LhgO
MVVLRTPVLSGRVRGDGFDLAISGDEPTSIRCRCLVNAAGLYAPALARTIDKVPRETIPSAYFCRGVYFSLTGRAAFRRLGYPVPPPGGLGVHLTLDLVRQARFCPDIEWISEVDCKYIRSAARRSVQRSGAIGRSYGMARCSPDMQGSGQRLADPTIRPWISLCRGRRSMACRGW